MQYPDRPAILLAGRSALHKQSAQYPNPRPARRRSRDAQHLRGLGSMTPAGVQRAAPSGARRKGAGAGQNPAAVRAGRRPGEGQESRGQRPLVHAAKARVQGRALPLSAQDAAPARGGSPEGRALWRYSALTRSMTAATERAVLSTSAASFASTMTRTSASVPEGRTRIRPSPKPLSAA